MIEGPPDTEAPGAPRSPDGGGDPPAAPSRASVSPRRLRSLLIGSTIALVLAVFLFVGLARKSGSGSDSGAVVGVGSVAPDFSLPSLTGGQPVDLDALGSDRQHPVVLNFFASWCVPCQQESPLLARTADAERAKGSTVQFVGVDVADQPADAIPFVEKVGINYPVGSDAQLRVTSGLYGLNGEPNTFFIDGTGHVIGHVLGALNSKELQQWLHRLAGAAG